MSSLDELIEEVVAFRDERDWAQFHRPEQLATALSIETAELQELFLWKPPEEIEDHLESSDFRDDLIRELADVLIFSLLLGHELNIDLGVAIRGKLEENRRKYPVEKAHGKADKYTDL